MAILLKCASRQHTLRLNPLQYWKKTICPQCRTIVDPLRIRRLVKVPAVFFEKDFVLVPLFVKSTVLPILGVIALALGLYLSYANSSRPNVDTSNVSMATGNVPVSNGVDLISNSNSNAAAGIPSTQIPITEPKTIAANTTTVNTTSSNSFEAGPALDPIELPTPTPETIRYSTGTNLITPSDVGGRGTIDISNGNSLDAIAKLVDASTNHTSRLVYVQSSNSTTIRNIASGSYILKFSLGIGYIKESGKFANSQSFSKFDETFEFNVSREGNRIIWNTYSVTLNPVIGGTARTSSISANDFEDH